MQTAAETTETTLGVTRGVIVDRGSILLFFMALSVDALRRYYNLSRTQATCCPAPPLRSSALELAAAAPSLRL